MMKRVVTIFALLLISTSTLFAQQNVKRVAILETVDKEGNVPYGVKLQLRSSLIYAISHTPGYEALERVDLPSIMDEQKFQRSGLVSDEEIKEIGRMNGADYVLVAEVAVYDESNILVMAKLINVVTGSIERSADPLTALKNPDKMKEACIEIARSLLGKKKRAVEPGYTDLGLPSGTIWKNYNANGFYTYDKAINQFDSRLPSKEQWEELKAECQWSWTGSGYKVTGPNGNSITLPAAGVRSCSGSVYDVGSFGSYWSSTSYSSKSAWLLDFSSGGVLVNWSSRCLGRSVRLVQD